MNPLSRIIITGRNSHFPTYRPRLVICDSCEGYGHIWQYDIKPSVKPYKVSCPDCAGDDATESSAVFRCLPAAERGRSLWRIWERPPHSGMKPVSGAAAVLRSIQTTGTEHFSLSFRAAAQSPVPTPTQAPGAFWALVADAVTFIIGMAVFCLIAGFFWVMA